MSFEIFSYWLNYRNIKIYYKQFCFDGLKHPVCCLLTPDKDTQMSSEYPSTASHCHNDIKKVKIPIMPPPLHIEKHRRSFVIYKNIVEVVKFVYLECILQSDGRRFWLSLRQLADSQWTTWAGVGQIGWVQRVKLRVGRQSGIVGVELEPRVKAAVARLPQQHYKPERRDAGEKV